MSRVSRLREYCNLQRFVCVAALRALSCELSTAVFNSKVIGKGGDGDWLICRSCFSIQPGTKCASVRPNRLLRQAKRLPPSSRQLQPQRLRLSEGQTDLPAMPAQLHLRWHRRHLSTNNFCGWSVGIVKHFETALCFAYIHWLIGLLYGST